MHVCICEPQLLLPLSFFNMEITFQALLTLLSLPAALVQLILHFFIPLLLTGAGGKILFGEL